VEVVRGASVVWTGKLNESVPTVAGQQIAAHGIGTLGADYAAFYGTPPGWTLNSPVDSAIARGLPWVNPGIAGGWLTLPPPDPASFFISDHLNNLTVPSAQVWQIDKWDTLRVGPIPSVVNRLLVTTDPVARTIADDVTTIWLRYKASDDGQGNTTYALTDAFNQDQINRHGPTERYADLSSGNVMSAGAAQAVGSQTLARYQRVTYAGTFTVRSGQYLTTGGTPVDLGCERAGAVCRLLVTDPSFGGEAAAAEIALVVGSYVYYSDSDTAQITAMQVARSDFASLLKLIDPYA
jgi:hypothetical protein